MVHVPLELQCLSLDTTLQLRPSSTEELFCLPYYVQQSHVLHISHCKNTAKIPVTKGKAGFLCVRNDRFLTESQKKITVGASELNCSPLLWLTFRVLSTSQQLNKPLSDETRMSDWQLGLILLYSDLVAFLSPSSV